MQIIYMLLRSLFVFALMPGFLLGNSFLTPKIKYYGEYKTGILSYDLKPLLGHVSPDAVMATKLDKLAHEKILKLSVVLNLNNQDLLDEYLINIHDKNHDLFGQYLEQEEFMAAYAPTQEQVDLISSYFAKNGLNIESVEPNRLIIKVSGSVADINRVFNTEIYTYQDKLGEEFYAPFYELKVDKSLPILSVLGLENRIKARSYAKELKSNFVSEQKLADGSLVSGFTPAD